MRIPRYIVIKLEMAGKDTVKATEITDRCEIYEYEADEDELQCEACINYGVEFTDDDSFDTCLANERHYEPKDKPQTEYDKYREKIRPHDPHKDWFEDDLQTERSDYHRSRKVCTLELFDNDGVYIDPQTERSDT